MSYTDNDKDIYIASLEERIGEDIIENHLSFDRYCDLKKKYDIKEIDCMAKDKHIEYLNRVIDDLSTTISDILNKAMDAKIIKDSKKITPEQVKKVYFEKNSYLDIHMTGDKYTKN